MDDLSDLTPLERAKRYRALASQARVEAEQAQDDVRSDLLRVAASWERLAETVEVVAARSIQIAEEATQPSADDKLAALKPPPAEPDET